MNGSNDRRRIALGAGVALALAAIVGSGAVLASAPNSLSGGGMMGGGMMGGGMMGGGMMGGGMMAGGMMAGGMMAGGTQAGSPQPGQPGFVAGTPSAPRVVPVLALPDLRFQPGTIVVQSGETIRFQVTTMGPFVHEFMVGPAADVAADREGTPEVADIGMMQTATLDYTFDSSGPYAFACHAPGHYEAGMAGTIVVVPA